MITVAPTLGFVLVVVAALVVWARYRGFDKSTHRECPSCLERMQGAASVCPHCHRESAPWTFRDGRWWRQGEHGWEYLALPGEGVGWQPMGE